MFDRFTFSYSCSAALLLSGLALGAGCSDGEEPIEEPMGTLLEAPAPGAGYQLVMNTELPAGTEAEHCQFVVGPPEDFYINRDEVRYSQGSHHFLLYETEYTSIPTQKEDGTPVDTSGVFDCSDGPTNGWRVTKLIGGSQNGSGDSIVAFPDGVAMHVAANVVLLMNAHYINASDQALRPEVNINLHTIPEEEVATPGDILFLYNPLIGVPANSTSRARWRCPVYNDITIVNVQSHMHARAVDYAVMIEGETPFYTNDAWEEVPVGRFDPGVEVPAGSRLDYYCDYMNPGPEAVYQGPRSNDEMCMVIGSYYPADQAMANCMTPSLDNLAGEWVGNGTATCADTLTCIQVAAAGGNFLRGMTDCVLASDPAISKETSDVVRCLVNSADPIGECGPEISACQAN